MVLFLRTSLDASGLEAFSVARSAYQVHRLQSNSSYTAIPDSLSFENGDMVRYGEILKMSLLSLPNGSTECLYLVCLDLGHNDLHHGQNQLAPVRIVPKSVWFSSTTVQQLEFQDSCNRSTCRTPQCLARDHETKKTEGNGQHAFPVLVALTPYYFSMDTSELHRIALLCWSRCWITYCYYNQLAQLALEYTLSFKDEPQIWYALN